MVRVVAAVHLRVLQDSFCSTHVLHHHPILPNAPHNRYRDIRFFLLADNGSSQLDRLDFKHATGFAETHQYFPIEVPVSSGRTPPEPKPRGNRTGQRSRKTSKNVFSVRYSPLNLIQGRRARVRRVWQQAATGIPAAPQPAAARRRYLIRSECLFEATVSHHSISHGSPGKTATQSMVEFGSLITNLHGTSGAVAAE